MFSSAVLKQVAAAAQRNGIEAAAFLAIAEVESAGVPFWSVRGIQAPPIRFEGHYFYKRLKGDKLLAAQRAGLANPKAGAVKNPSAYQARYELFERALKIDAKAAIESTSWGFGQVMGAHWEKLGYSSPQALVDSCATLDGQSELMIRYIIKFGLKDELETHGWKPFADQYNGPASAKNNYAAKIAAAYKLYVKVLAGGEPTAKEAAPWLADLATLGYTGTTAVSRFQKDNGLVIDGKVGKMTLEEIERELTAKRKAQGKAVTGAGVATSVGVSAVGETLKTQAAVLATIGIDSSVLTYVTAALTIAGVAVTLFGLYRSWKA